MGRGRRRKRKEPTPSNFFGLEPTLRVAYTLLIYTATYDNTIGFRSTVGDIQ